MLPDKYKYLETETGPKMIVEAVKLYGTLEVPGEGDNPKILAWAKEVDLANTYTHDSIYWCGLFMAVVAKRAGKEVPFGPLWALNWSKFGVKVEDGAKLGDVLTFRRSGGGHVALYVGEDADTYHVLGGNQADSVNITRILKPRLHSIRRPVYNVQPVNVRKIFLGEDGIISENEK